MTEKLTLKQVVRLLEAFESEYYMTDETELIIKLCREWREQRELLGEPQETHPMTEKLTPEQVDEAERHFRNYVRGPGEIAWRLSCEWHDQRATIERLERENASFLRDLRDLG